MHRLVPRKTAVIVVDIQERLVPAMPERRLADVVRATTILVESARLLGAPIFATVQYPKGLGPMLEAVARVLSEAGVTPIEKTHFSAMDAPGFADALRRSEVTDAVVVGMETHVCVHQTVRDLRAVGYAVHVPSDGVCSRRDDAREAGLSLAVRCGAAVTTAETVVLIEGPAAAEFRAIVG